MATPITFVVRVSGTPPPARCAARGRVPPPPVAGPRTASRSSPSARRATLKFEPPRPRRGRGGLAHRRRSGALVHPKGPGAAASQTDPALRGASSTHSGGGRSRGAGASAVAPRRGLAGARGHARVLGDVLSARSGRHGLAEDTAADSRRRQWSGRSTRRWDPGVYRLAARQLTSLKGTPTASIAAGDQPRSS